MIKSNTKTKLWVKNKTLIVYNKDGAECDTKFPICDIKRFSLCEDGVAVIIDTKSKKHIVALEPADTRDEYTTSFRVDV